LKPFGASNDGRISEEVGTQSGSKISVEVGVPGQARSVLDHPGKSDEPDIDTLELYAQIGQLKVENQFLKKKF